MSKRLDEDEFADNAADTLDDDDEPVTWADLRLRTPGRELRRRQEAEYQGFDPDDYDY